MKIPAYDFLDTLPDSLYQAVVTHTHGSLTQRCKGVLQWRQALHAGCLPDDTNWPEPEFKKLFCHKLLQENRLQQTVNNIAYCDQLLIELLAYLTDEPDELILRDANNEQHHANTSVTQDSDSEQMLAMLRDFAVVNVAGMDKEQGLWKHGDRHKLLQLYRLIKRSSYLRSIMMLIGRGQKKVKTGAGEQGCMSRQQPLSKQRESAEGAWQARGIYLGDDISRMLPAELMALGHPLLKSLWHARRAERRLMCYQYDGVLPTHTPDFDLQTSDDKPLPDEVVRQQGPILLCLDTSASMKGLPELRARAVVLEAMRVALQTKRQCLLFMFSGTDDIQEYVLEQSVTGWRNILRVIDFSFHGGTDVGGVLLHALAKLQQTQWQDADVCLISDGRFMADTVVECINRMPDGDAFRLHGLHVSRWNARQMERLCQPVYHLENLWGNA